MTTNDKAPAAMAAPATNVTKLPTPAWGGFIKKADKVGMPQSIFLYGVPGTRKTSIMASAIKVPGIKKMLVIDTDGGTSVLASDPAFADIDIISIDPLEPGAISKIDSIVEDVARNGYGYDAVGFDTLSVSQDVSERHLKEKYAGSKNTFAVFGDLGEWTDSIVRRLHSSPHFVAVITCHSSEKKSETGTVEIKPKLSGSSKDSIGAIPDVVAHLSFASHPETGERHLVANVGESDATISKSRYRIDPVIVDFDLPKLYTLIEQKIGKGAAKAA